MSRGVLHIQKQWLSYVRWPTSAILPIFALPFSKFPLYLCRFALLQGTIYPAQTLFMLLVYLATPEVCLILMSRMCMWLHIPVPYIFHDILRFFQLYIIFLWGGVSRFVLLQCVSVSTHNAVISELQLRVCIAASSATFTSFLGMSMWVLLLSLLWSLVEVHSQQTFPYVSFMSQTLTNHSYVDLSLVGDRRDGNGVQCHTDMDACCSAVQRVHPSRVFNRGDWYFPDGTRLPFPGGSYIYELRGAQRVGLHCHNSTTSLSGIYRCDIPTNAVHDDNDISVRDTVYVGLYAIGGKSRISMVHSFLRKLNHELGNIQYKL